MYQVGEQIVYGMTGVCRVEAVGPLDMQGAKEGVDYYTLVPVYQGGRIFIPVDTAVFNRPVMTKEEAMTFIEHIPEIESEICEDRNPRLLNERYQGYLKSGDCTDLVRLIRAVYQKGKRAARTGRHLSQVDERSMRRAEEMLHNELASALGIEPGEVKGFITKTLEK